MLIHGTHVWLYVYTSLYVTTGNLEFQFVSLRFESYTSKDAEPIAIYMNCISCIWTTLATKRTKMTK